jgi:dTDP-3-amino-3,4,6-trideoxy-alpha-D-glucose transaminase
MPIALDRSLARPGTAPLGPPAPASVPFVDLHRQHLPVADELRATFDRVLGASAFVLGSEVAAFEAEFADFCGVAHCVGVGSGTAALSLALLAAGIGPGDEVIVPGHTFIASALAVVHAGATPVFCDVDDATGLIDARCAEAAITSRTAAILPVHLYGQACDMQAVCALARRHGLFVLEDAAQAHGATLAGRRAGSLADAAAFSFYPSKNLGALGDGGAVCTDDPAIADRVRQLRNLGQPRKGDHVEVGFNERLDGLQAALLRVKLPHLDAANAARRKAAAEYRAALDGCVGLLGERADSPCTYHVFPIRLEDRDGAAEFLASHGIATGVHYFPAAFAHAAWDSVLGPPAQELAVATAWAREELSLPMFAEIEPAEIERVIDACYYWLQRSAT